MNYNYLHEWVRKRKPKPELCEDCKKEPPRDLANISGEYKTDINDFKWICRRCHITEDNRIEQLRKNAEAMKSNITECKSCGSTKGRFKNGLCQKCYDKIAWQKRKGGIVNGIIRIG